MSKAIIYCEKCGKIIPPDEIDRGRAMAFEDVGVCPECVASLSPGEREEVRRRFSGKPPPDGTGPKAPTTTVPRKGPREGGDAAEPPPAQSGGFRAIIYCEKCGKIIPPSEIDRGKAMVFEHVGVCPDCAASLSPAERKEITHKLSGPPASAPAAGRGKAATARKPRAPQRTEGAPARRLAGRRSHTGVTVAVIAAAALAGVAVALMGGFGSREGPPKTPGGPTGAGAGSGNSPSDPGDPPGARAVAARKRLYEIKALIDPSRGRYAEARAEARAALTKFLEEFGDAHEAAQAKELLAKIDAELGAMADQALEKAVKSAEGLASEGKPVEARKALGEVRERFAGTEWFKERGEKAIAGALGKIDAARVEAVKAALARASEALESKKFGEARAALESRATWPEDPRARADGLLKKIDEAEAKVEAKEKAKDAWAVFLLGFMEAGKLGLGEAKAFLERERKALGKLGADKDIARKLERIERRFREVGLVEELAEVGLRGSRGTIYFVWKGERVGGKVKEVEKGVVSLVTTRGKQLSVPVAEVAGPDVVRFSRTMQQGGSGKLRAAAYLLLRGDPVAARKASKDATGDAAWALGDQIDEFVQAIEAREARREAKAEADRAAAEARTAAVEEKAAAEAEERRKTGKARRKAEAAAQGLVGHWEFDDGEGATAKDASGNGNHGTVKGGARWAKGKIGGALLFFGNDPRVAIPNEAAFDITGNITVAAWIKVASFTKVFQAVITKGDESWRLQRNGKSRVLEWTCTGLKHNRWGEVVGKTVVDDNRWHHLAGVYDGTTSYLYVDGKVDASHKTSGSIRATNHRVCIGHNVQRKGRHFSGIIDDVRIYNRALTASGIRALAADLERGLVAHWRFDEKVGTRAADSAPRRRSPGTLKGGPTWLPAGGRAGGALEFDGKDDCVFVWKYPKPKTAMTYAAWVWADSRPMWGSIVKNWGGKKKAGQMHMGLSEKDGDLEAHFREADDDEVQLREGRAKRFPLGSWQHVAVVADGTTARLYRNAVEVTSAPFDGTLKTSVRALGIGAKPDDSGMKPDKGNAGYWDGKIDDVRVYDRALWVEEIKALATSK